jgi:cytochrome b pre-mRNA-processing protein 3
LVIPPESFPPLIASPALMLTSLKTRAEIHRKAGKLYGAIVTQARQPDFYSALGIADTPGGRYEMVVLHLFLVLEWLRTARSAAPDLPRLLVEVFITDMDDSLREMGTGDLAVPKKVRRAAAGLYERSTDYKAALSDGDGQALAAALAKHAHAGGVVNDASRALAAYVRAAVASLVSQDEASVLAGQFALPSLSAAAEMVP